MSNGEDYVAYEMNAAQHFMDRWWYSTVLRRTVFSLRFWREPWDEYPQYWYYMPYWRPARNVAQWVCGVLIGHDLSKTEWGYGGGDTVDRHCRWCDKLHKVPISEARFSFPTFNEWRPDKEKELFANED